MEADPIGLEGGINRWGYVGGGPVSEDDAMGLKSSLSTCAANCALNQLGIGSILSAAGIGVTAPVPKKWVSPGASGVTSPWSQAFGDKGRMPINPFTGNRQWPAPTLNNVLSKTAKVGRFVGRWIPIVGTVFLAYDFAEILICTEKCQRETCGQK